MAQNLNEGYKAIALLAPTVKTASFTGASVDIEQYLDDSVVVLQVAEEKDTSGSASTSFQYNLEASTDGTTFTTLVTLGSITITDTKVASGINAAQASIGAYKNVRVVGSFVTTGTPTAVVSCNIIADSGVNQTGLNSADGGVVAAFV